MKLELRYERSFLQDLQALEPDACQRIRQFVFNDFLDLKQLQDLPELRQIGTSQIYYRFTLDNYLIGLELTGGILKFLRILPKPEL